MGVSLQVSPGGLFTTTGTSLNDLIKLAYDLHPRQIISGSSWLETEKYDVTGKPDQPGKPELEHLKVMVQSRLADRFQLTFHRDRRELSVSQSGLQSPDQGWLGTTAIRMAFRALPSDVGNYASETQPWRNSRTYCRVPVASLTGRLWIRQDSAQPGMTSP